MTFLRRSQGLASRWKPKGRKPLLDNVTRPARDYEMMTILIPDMAEEDTQAALEKVRGYITDVNAEISNVLTDSPWGRRRLAYTIRHEGVDYRDGFYSVIHFTAQPNTIGEIERELKLDTNVIRYLLVMDDPKAGEKVQEQPETEAAATEDAPAEAPAEAATTTQETAATEETPAAEEAPVAEAAQEAPANDETADTETEAAVEETAETIEGEEEPAPADGAEAEAVETKES